MVEKLLLVLQLHKWSELKGPALCVHGELKMRVKCNVMTNGAQRPEGIPFPFCGTRTIHKKM